MAATVLDSSAQPPRKGPKTAKATQLGYGLRWSLVGHGSLLFFLLLKTVFFPSQYIPYIPSMRVDVVDLPDLLKKDIHGTPKAASSQQILDALKNAEKSAKKVKEVKVEKAEPDEMVLHPKVKAPEAPAKNEKKVERRNSDILKRMRALERISADTDAETAPKVIKGNRISKGSSLSSDSRESQNTSYNDALRDRLQENWALAPWLARQNYSAQAQIWIDARGHLRRFTLIKFSGNAQFDAAVKKAILTSDPFPAPPEDIAGSLLADGVLIGFPL